MKMMKIVKTILFRRSGTRNMFAKRENPDIGHRPPGWPEAGSLPVGQRIAARRGTGPPRQRQHLSRPTRGFDCTLRGFGEAVRPHRERLVEFAARQHLHKPTFG